MSQFLRSYRIERIEEPPSGIVDHEFLAENGAEHCVAFVVTIDDVTWAGRFCVDPANLRSSFSGVVGTPSPDRACLVEAGTPLLVEARRPQESRVLDLSAPITAALEVADGVGRLALATPWTVASVDGSGRLAESRRIAIDGLRLESCEDEWLKGVADPSSSEPRPFRYNLRTGEVVGGVPPSIL